MRSVNKLTQNQLNYLTNIPSYVTKRQRKEFNQIKNHLLDEIKKTFGCSWFRMKEGTQKAFDFVCFLSVEKGYFYASASKTADKHGISEKTMYRLLKTLIDEGILTKKNFESSKHNGLGNAVYFFKQHPYFKKYVQILDFNTDENYNESDNEKAEVTVKPCPASDLSDNAPVTYSLPNNSPKEFKDLHPNVSPVKFTQFVPKVINHMFHNKLGSKLRTVWIKVNQAFRFIKHPMLTKDSLYIIAKRLCFQLIKNNKRLSVMDDDQLAAYSYKSALNMFYETISHEFLTEITLNSSEIDLEYDFLANQTYVLLPPHKHTSMNESYERVDLSEGICDSLLSIRCNEIVYTLEHEITKVVPEINFSQLKEQILDRISNEQEPIVVKYIKNHYEELTFNKHKLEQEQEAILAEYRELAQKLDNERYESIHSGLPF